MRKTVTCLAVSSLLTITANVAVAKGPSGLDYANGGLAIQDVDGISDLGLAIYGMVGKKLPDIHRNFSVEGETSYSLIDASSGGVDVSFFTLAGYAAYSHHMSSDLMVKGRAGLAFGRSEADCGGACKGTSDTDIDLSLGAGVIYDYQRDFKLTADWTMVTGDLNHLSAGVRYDY